MFAALGWYFAPTRRRDVTLPAAARRTRVAAFVPVGSAILATPVAISRARVFRRAANG